MSESTKNGFAPEGAKPGFNDTKGILAALPPGFMSPLITHATRQKLAKGERLFEMGDPGDGCYWLERGTLKVTVSSERGVERILSILGPGSIVGELSMIDGLARSASVEAMTDSALSFISRQAFVDRLREFPDVHDYLVTTLAARLRQADDEVAATSFLTARARVARALLQFGEHLGRKTSPAHLLIQHDLQQTELAAMAGVARESVSRILRKWKRDKTVVRDSSGRYAIDPTKLEREAQSS